MNGQSNDASPIPPEEFGLYLERACSLSPPNDGPLAVAVSGGSDSLALALLTKQWAEERDRKLTALIVDHGLRATSAEEAKTVVGWLKNRSIPAVVLKPGKPIAGGNLQEKAREIRYDLMVRWCKQHAVKHLLLAHHADDQLETILMRLVRGSGLEGLCGMRLLSERDGIALVRPLLSVSKSRLKATLEHMGQAWVEDPTNEKPQFTRNRMRRIAQLLTEEGLTANRVACVAENLQSANRFIARQADTFIAEHAEMKKNGHAETSLSCWRHADIEIARRALVRLLCLCGAQAKPPRQKSLEPVLRALMTGTLVKRIPLHHCLLLPDPARDRLRIAPEGTLKKRPAHPTSRGKKGPAR